MGMGWKWAGVAAAIFATAPVARAHLLECVKEVNGEIFFEVDTYPVDLTYSLTVRNIHPDSDSEVLEATDQLLEDHTGFEGFDTPFTIPFGDDVTKTHTVTLESERDCLRLAALDGTVDDFIDNVFDIRWDSGFHSCPATVQCTPEPPPPPNVDGRRMTGGGSVFGTGQNRVTHGFQIRCDEDDVRQNLEVNWRDGSGAHQFHLLDMTSATCSDDPALNEAPPVAGFDTYVGVGTGRYDGVEGATIEFTFTDDGEPGSDDVATMVIRDAGGNIVLSVSGDLNFGNHQAHGN